MSDTLDHVINVIHDDSAQLGYILIDDINQKFGESAYGWQAGPTDHPDLALLQKLRNLTSFDIYSLRILFRTQNIPSPDTDRLRLSAETRASLETHLKRFTAPLILNVYGGDHEVSVSGDPIELFRNPDRSAAMRNLQQLAEKLEIDLEAIPEFLERFSDCYLSISYFERYLHKIYPEITAICAELETLKSSRSMRGETAVQEACDRLILELNNLTLSALGKIERFHKETGAMWQNLTADRFYEISELVRSYQISVAGVLCGLGIKTMEWRKRFETADTGSPMARAEVALSSMLPGMNRLKIIDHIVELDPSLQIE
ncbi:MAG: hypothetical protein ACPGRZ_00020 [Alphaproteobacteria bacterium]